MAIANVFEQKRFVNASVMTEGTLPKQPEGTTLARVEMLSQTKEVSEAY